MLKRVLMSVAMLSLLLSFNAFGDTESALTEENTFTDKKGEDNNKLGKGDVATKGEMDNPSHGKKLDVTVPRKNGGSATYQMTKADNGNLPDAVLDIW